MPSKTYKVVGTAPILDHQPGSTFTADLSDIEDYLVSIGGLEIVEDDKPPKQPKPAKAPTVPVEDLPAPILNPSVPIPRGDAD